MFSSLQSLGCASFQRDIEYKNAHKEGGLASTQD